MINNDNQRVTKKIFTANNPLPREEIIQILTEEILPEEEANTRDLIAILTKLHSKFNNEENPGICTYCGTIVHEDFSPDAPEEDCKGCKRKNCVVSAVLLILDTATNLYIV